MIASSCQEDKNNGESARERKEMAGGSSHQVFAVMKFIAPAVYAGVEP